MSDIDEDRLNGIYAIIGGLFIFLGLLGHYLRKYVYISDAIFAVSIGIIIGPIGAGLIFNHSDLIGTNFSWLRELTRLSIALQLMSSGLQLPKTWWNGEGEDEKRDYGGWKAIAVFVGLVMPLMWMSSAAFAFAFLHPYIDWLSALVVGACVTPTDPVLSSSIVRGKFARNHIPASMRNLLQAESSINDGAAYPMVFLGIYLVKAGQGEYSFGHAWAKWFYWVWAYQILLSCLVAYVLGFLAARAYEIAEKHKTIDNSTFLVYTIALSFLVLSVIGLMGGNDILGVFVASLSFTFNSNTSSFRTLHDEHKVQEAIDLFTVVIFFVYFGTIIPWNGFGELGVGKLSIFSAFVIASGLRRIPQVFICGVMPKIGFHGWMKNGCCNWKQGLFVGWFGPVGVAALYYSAIIHEELENDDIFIIVSYIALSSVLFHGLTATVFSKIYSKYNVSSDCPHCHCTA